MSGLVNGRTYYWRVRVSDPKNQVTSAYSATGSFVAQSFNFSTAKIWDNPVDLSVWPETARITSIDFTGDAMRVDFDRRDGANRWAEQVWPSMGPIQYTLGMCRYVEGGWHCSAVIEFWYGRDLASTAPPADFAREWWYEPRRWGALSRNPPQEGEIVGVFVGSGDLRGRDSLTRATCPGFCERSNVAFVRFTTGFASYKF